MANQSDRTEPLVLYGVMVLVGLALIAVGVFTRDSIGLFAGWLVMSLGILTALAVPLLWHKRHKSPPK